MVLSSRFGHNLLLHLLATLLMVPEITGFVSNILQHHRVFQQPAGFL